VNPAWWSLVVSIAALALAAASFRYARAQGRIAIERHQRDREPDVEVTAAWLNRNRNVPQIELVHRAGQDLDNVDVLVLPPLAGSLRAGQLLTTERGDVVECLSLGPMALGEQKVVRVRLDADQRGTTMRLQLTCRRKVSRRGWLPFRVQPDDEWKLLRAVEFPRPASVHSAAGITIPRESDVRGRR
jgi:hypothetical protein